MASKKYVSKKHHRQICPSCHERNMVRIGRVGYFQNSVYPIFGFYPWECWKCRVVKLLRNRGERSRSSAAREPQRVSDQS